MNDNFIITASNVESLLNKIKDKIEGSGGGGSKIYDLNDFIDEDYEHYTFTAKELFDSMNDGAHYVAYRIIDQESVKTIEVGLEVTNAILNGGRYLFHAIDGAYDSEGDEWLDADAKVPVFSFSGE